MELQRRAEDALIANKLHIKIRSNRTAVSAIMQLTHNLKIMRLQRILTTIRNVIHKEIEIKEAKKHISHVVKNETTSNEATGLMRLEMLQTLVIQNNNSIRNAAQM